MLVFPALYLTLSLKHNTFQYHRTVCREAMRLSTLVRTFSNAELPIPLKRVCTHRNEKHQVDFRLRHPLLSLSELMVVQPGIYTGPKPRTHTSLLASLPCLVPSSGKIISPSLMPFRACAQCTAAPRRHAQPSLPLTTLTYTPICSAGESFRK